MADLILTILLGIALIFGAALAQYIGYGIAIYGAILLACHIGKVALPDVAFVPIRKAKEWLSSEDVRKRAGETIVSIRERARK